MLMLDLCSGLGGASKAMKERGWDVITVDVNPEFSPDIVADITTFHYTGPQPDLVWASPPCTEFSKTTMPAFFPCNRKCPPKPDTIVMEHSLRIIREIRPRWWVIENVRGAIPYFEPILGPYRKKSGSRYLWGNFPIFDCPPGYGKRNGWKTAAERSVIPYPLSKALCLSIEIFHSSPEE